MISTALDEKPFDIRSAPLWAVPTLRFLMNVKNMTILYFNVDHQGTPESCGVVCVKVEGLGIYKGILRKVEEGEKPRMPRLFFDSLNNS